MARITPFAVALCCVGFAVSTWAAPRTVPEYDARTFYATTSFSGASFSADETRILFSSDASGVFNAYSIPITGGQPTQLTNSKTHAITAIGYFPHDDRILVTQDEGGNELNHVYVRELDGTLKDLTPGNGLKASFEGWSRDLGSFYVTTNERDKSFFDLYRYDAKTFERTMVFKNTGGFGQIDISRDGQRVALVKIRTNSDNDVYIWNPNHPEIEPKKITVHEGDVSHGINGFDPESKHLFFSSNEGGEFARIWSYNLATGEKKIAAEDKWDVMSLQYSWNGRFRSVGVNADARTVVSVTDTKSNKSLKLPDVGTANIAGGNFSRSENLLAFYVAGDNSPANLHVLDLRTNEHRKLTTALDSKVNPEHLVTASVVRYPSFDNLPIPALLYKPHGATADKKVPALVWVHGGPGGQSRVGYSPDIQFLVNHGYAVLAVNNRGSSGYGKTFFHQDDKKHGDVDLKDCIYGRRYLESLDWVDKTKVGIIGGSYGGYMTCAALAFEPDAFEVGIDIFGVTNWLRTLTSIPPWWASARDSLYAELGDPATDSDRLKKISPLFHAKNIRKPLLVVQGANDPRVLKAESDEIVAAVKSNNVPVEYVVFPDEGHGFRRKENRITAAEAYRKFLDTHLLGRGSLSDK